MLIRNFHHDHLVGLALKPQSITSATVNGPDIVEPWVKGDTLALILLGGTFATNADAAVRIQGKKRSDGNYVTLTDKNSATLQFPVTLLDDGGEAESAARLGTIPLEEIDAETYSALRVVAQESGGGAVLLGVGYVISGLRNKVSGQVDDLFSLLH